MGVGGVCYPISDEVKQGLTRFPKIAAWLQLPASGKSELEIVRLLDNTHYDHLEKLLGFVEHWIECARPISDRIMETKDPFQLDQALAELFLFAYLASELRDQVYAAQGRPDQSMPDIEVAWNGRSVLVEVFTPVDFMGFQLVDSHVTRILKYLDIARGYLIEVALRPAREHDLWYVYAVEDEIRIRRWLREFADDAKAWLGQERPPRRRIIHGPEGEWRVDVWLRELHDDPRGRLVVSTTGTHSTDTRLFFECGTVENSAQSQWGKKLKGKLAKRQCGDPAPHKLRILVVNFGHASTGWPDFICWPEIAQRMAAVVKLLADDLGGALPYDLAVPAQLGIECCFGPMITLDPVRQHEASAFVRAAGLDKPCVPRMPNEVDWLALLSGEENPPEPSTLRITHESKPKL
jgi:hypothetical protein